MFSNKLLKNGTGGVTMSLMSGPCNRPKINCTGKTREKWREHKRKVRVIEAGQTSFRRKRAASLQWDSRLGILQDA